MKPYSKDELWRIYEKLPQELKIAVFSEETALDISNTCERHNINNTPTIATYTGYVLLGLILPQDLAKTLAQDAGLTLEIAEAVSRDLNRLVFYPVKPELEQLHQMEIRVMAKIVTPEPEQESEEQKPQQKWRPDDPYHESI